MKNIKCIKSRDRFPKSAQILGVKKPLKRGFFTGVQSVGALNPQTFFASTRGAVVLPGTKSR